MWRRDEMVVFRFGFGFGFGSVFGFGFGLGFEGERVEGKVVLGELGGL